MSSRMKMTSSWSATSSGMYLSSFLTRAGAFSSTNLCMVVLMSVKPDSRANASRTCQ